MQGVIKMVKKAKKSKLASRYAESYNSRNSGGKRAGVIDWKKLDGDVKFFTPKEGRNRINIICKNNFWFNNIALF